MVTSRSLHHVLVGATGTALLLLCATVHSQDLQVSPSEYDHYAASQARNVKRHAWPAHTPAARSMPVTALSSSHDTSAAAAPAAAAPDSGGPRFPADLDYNGGPVAASMENHAIYLHPNGGCTIAACWGNPERFLRDLGESEFIHVVDQYTGNTANNRYTVAEERTNINYTPPSTPFTDADMLAIVHAVASRTGDTGYGHVYHIFLPPGQDECFDSTFSVCYSPDNLQTFVFCAYHGSMDFSDIGHILYSVEPFQNVHGCNLEPGTPNGQLVDSTNDVLSHETFETITDPDGTAWFNDFNQSLFQQEIGDECSFLAFNAAGSFIGFDPSNVTLNGRKYAVQPEYNNAQHACTTAP